MLLFAYFAAFLKPETIYTFEVDQPALFSELDCDPAVAIPRMLHMQDEQIVNYRLIFLRQLMLISLSTPGLAQYCAGPAL